MTKRFAVCALIAVLVFSLAGSTQAENADVPAVDDWDFLYDASILREIRPGAAARTAGLGAAGTAAANGSEALFWNPALLALSDGLTGSFSQTPSASADAAAPPKRAGIAFSGAMKAVGAQDNGYFGTAASFDGWGTDILRNRSAAFGYALPLPSGFAAGASIRYEHRVAPTSAVSAWAMDAGTVWSGSLVNGDRLRLGLAAANIGARFRNAEAQNLPSALSPFIMRAGAAYARMDGGNPQWRIASDLAYIDDPMRMAQDRFRWAVGAETYLMDGLLAARAGYNTIANYYRLLNGMGSVGASAQIRGGSLDYAFTWGYDGFTGSVGRRHMLTMAFQWTGGTRAVRETRPEPEPELQLILPDSPDRYVYIENDVFSPNGDGIRDEARFRFRNLPKAAAMEIRNRSGETVHTFDLSRSPESAVWSGGGAEDGIYSWLLTENGQILSKGVVAVDNAPPRLRIETTPAAFAGAGETIGAVTAHVEDGNGVESWTLDARGGASVTRLHQGSEPTASIPIDALKPGARYMLALSAIDEAGNRAELKQPFSALDLRGLDAWIENGYLFADMPESAFNNAQSGLNARGAAAAGAFSLATESGYTVFVGTGASDSALSKARADELYQYMTVFGADPNLARIGAPPSARRSTAPVRVAVQNAPPAAQAVQPAPAPKLADAFRILAGSYRNFANAERARSALSGAGFPAVVENRAVKSETYYRVMVGRYGRRSEAEEARQKVSAHVESEPIILPPAAQ